MSIGEMLYLGMVIAMFLGFLVLIATLSWLDVKESRVTDARREPASAKAGHASGKPAAQH